MRAIKVFKTRFADKVGEKSAMALAEHIESTLKPGFFRCSRSDDSARPEIHHGAPSIRSIRKGAPILVLLHGTFSSNNGSFADLAEPVRNKVQAQTGDTDLWQVLEAAFPGGILALQHRTVTVDPIRNALDLVKALPKGARPSLLSHSRGG